MSDKIKPCLWFDGNAEEAANFYAEVIPGSSVDAVHRAPADYPSGKAGDVLTVEFTLAGQSFTAMDAGPLDPFNHAISLMVNCADQAEVDRIWNALCEGGAPERCGWLKDRYGVSWQIVPTALGEMMKDKDRARAGRVAEAMLRMVKLDVAGLRRAYDGASPLR